MASDSFKTECKDWRERVGCHKEIIMKKDSDGWHPYNADGSRHKHLGNETGAKPLTVEVSDAMKKNEAWVRLIAREEAGKVLSEHGIGFKSE